MCRVALLDSPCYSWVSLHLFWHRTGLLELPAASGDMAKQGEAEEVLQGHHRLIPAREPPGGKAQHSPPPNPELAAAAGSALHSALNAPFQASASLARTPAQKKQEDTMSQTSGKSVGVLCTSPAYAGVSDIRAEHSRYMACSDNQVGSHAAFLCVTSSSQRVQVMLCPFQQPFLNNACLVKIGCASYPHLFELDAQHVKLIYGGLHLR